MKLKEITSFFENWAPSSYQESYDNSRLIVGDINADIDKCIVCLDCIEAVVDEAIEKKAQLIIAHHPIVFSGLKSFTGKNYIERVVVKAIQNNIAIYAIHTNLDNVLDGVNAKIAEKLELVNTSILAPKNGILNKLVTFVPSAYAEKVKEALFTAGAGAIGDYKECSFQNEGLGNFKATDNANPFVGNKGERHSEKEVRVEVIIPMHKKHKVIDALIATHPYEEVAYDVYALENTNNNVGSGLVGELENEMPVDGFMAFVKNNLNTDCIRYTQKVKNSIKRVALCGGAGSFLLNNAIRANADVFITGDFKYHQFFDADEKLMILDVGHFESEQFTIDLIAEKLQENFPIFAVLKTDIVTNPISYFK